MVYFKIYKNPVNNVQYKNRGGSEGGGGDGVQKSMHLLRVVYWACQEDVFN